MRVGERYSGTASEKTGTLGRTARFCAVVTFASIIGYECFASVPQMIDAEARRESRAVPAGRIWILSPYHEQQEFWFKAQTHAHSSRYVHKKWHLWPPGVYADYTPIPPVDLVRAYASGGYKVLAITDHYYYLDNAPDHGVSCSDTFTDPGIPGMLYFPSMEVQDGAPHLLLLGIPAVPGEPCRPTDCPGGCNLPDQCGDIRHFPWFVRWIEQRGGLAVVAHPGPCFPRSWLSLPWLRGMEIKNPESRTAWDDVLSVDKQRWGFASDDKHEKQDIDTTGYIVVNAKGLDWYFVRERLRLGAFYSVMYAPVPDVAQANACRSAACVSPEFIRITDEADGVIRVCVRNATHAVVRTREAETPTRLVAGTGEHAGHLHITYPQSGSEGMVQVDGSEGYIRFEVKNGTPSSPCAPACSEGGPIAYSQPIFVGGKSREELITIDKSQLKTYTTALGQLWGVTDNRDFTLPIGSKEDAERVIELIGRRSVDQYGRIGGNNDGSFENMQYLVANGQAPVSIVSGENCIPFSLENLRLGITANVLGHIEQHPERPYKEWRILDGPKRVLASFGDSQVRARRGLEIIERYGFTHRCTIGPAFHYFIKCIDSTCPTTPACSNKECVNADCCTGYKCCPDGVCVKTAEACRADPREECTDGLRKCPTGQKCCSGVCIPSYKSCTTVPR